MIPLARRYSLAALALFAIAAVPIWLHRIGSARTDACLRLPLQHLAAYGENYAVVVVNERDASFLDIWVDGRLPPFAGRRPLFFRIVRSWDPFRFYNDLPRYFLHGPLPEDLHELRPLKVGPDVLPVHHQVDASGGPQKLTKYFFAVDDEPVEQPLRADLSNALDQLFRGTRPVTLFLISGTANAPTLAAFEDHANSWLAAVWAEYQRACRP